VVDDPTPGGELFGRFPGVRTKLWRRPSGANPLMTRKGFHAVIRIQSQIGTLGDDHPLQCSRDRLEVGQSAEIARGLRGSAVSRQRCVRLGSQ